MSVTLALTFKARLKFEQAQHNRPKMSTIAISLSAFHSGVEPKTHSLLYAVPSIKVLTGGSLGALAFGILYSVLAATPFRVVHGVQLVQTVPIVCPVLSDEQAVKISQTDCIYGFT